MKLNKCFTSTFDPFMKQVGFARAGILYYRMNGNMLQGMRLEATNPYRISFSNFPYWLYHKRNVFPEPNIRKGGWTQTGGMILSMDTYYDENDPTRNDMIMRKTLDLFRDTVLPYFDSICNEYDYFHMTLNRPIDLLLKYKDLPSSMENGLVKAIEQPTAEMFLYNQHYIPGSQSAEEEVEKYYQASLQELNERVTSKEIDDALFQTAFERLQREKAYYLKKIDLINQEGFINIYQTMCTEMKQMLLNDLKINPDILRC